MKKVHSSIAISILILFVSGCITVQRSAPSQTDDSNKVSPVGTQPDLQNSSFKYFTSAKSGNPSLQQGINELSVVNQNFADLNTTNITSKGTKTGQRLVSLIENLSINVNTRNFDHIPEGDEPWIKPGQIIRAKSLIIGKPDIIDIPRNPLLLSINGVANSSYQVQHPEQNSQLQQAEKNLIAKVASPSSESISFSFHKIHSIEEMEFKLTGKYRGVLTSLPGESGLKTGNQQESHFYMIEYHQKVFSINTSDMIPANTFIQPGTDMSDYVYIDKVDYGQKGIILFKSGKTVEELGINVAKNYTGLSEQNIRAVYKKLSGKKDVQVFAQFYGGASSAALTGMKNSVRNGVSDVVSFVKSQPINQKLALPIGYTLKNMNNQLVGQKSNKRQTVTTISKAPAPIVSMYKLKVTLTDIQCITARDGISEIDDYGIQQYIVYKALGKEKKFVSRDINKLANRIDMVGQVPNILNPLIMGDMKNQIHVLEDPKPKLRDRNMINNSMVFHVSSNELNDPNSSFKIFTWLKEYSTTFFGNNDDKVLLNNGAISVKVKDVIEILKGSKKLKDNTQFPVYNIGENIKFHNFGAGYLYLTNIQKIEPMVLEGPIPVTNINSSSETDKFYPTTVAVWIQFELID